MGNRALSTLGAGTLQGVRLVSCTAGDSSSLCVEVEHGLRTRQKKMRRLKHRRGDRDVHAEGRGGAGAEERLEESAREESSRRGGRSELRWG